MKRIVSLFLFLLCACIAQGQNILTFFESIPDSSILDLTVEDRERITRRALDGSPPANNSDDLVTYYQFETLDIRNGYLRLIGPFEGHVQMCYWNKSNGRKLIAIYHEACGPLCTMERLDFYEFDGVHYTPMEWYTLIPDIYGAFFNGDMDQQEEEMAQLNIEATLLFQLPQTGKNMIAKWGNEASQDDYRPFAYGDRMTLIWNDGYFSRGEIYWEK